MSHHHIGQSEICSGSERKVTHDEAICKEKTGFISIFSLVYQVENYFWQVLFDYLVPIYIYNCTFCKFEQCLGCLIYTVNWLQRWYSWKQWVLQSDYKSTGLYYAIGLCFSQIVSFEYVAQQNLAFSSALYKDQMIGDLSIGCTVTSLTVNQGSCTHMYPDVPVMCHVLRFHGQHVKTLFYFWSPTNNQRIFWSNFSKPKSQGIYHILFFFKSYD